MNTPKPGHTKRAPRVYRPETIIPYNPNGNRVERRASFRKFAKDLRLLGRIQRERAAYYQAKGVEVPGT